MPRTRPALHGKLIGNALQAYVPTSGLRSEEHRKFREFFVDSGARYVDTLLSPDWQLIYGRRGTGKTHLLGYFETEAASESAWVVNLSAQLLYQRTAGADIALVSRARERFVALTQALAAEISARFDAISASPARSSTGRTLLWNRAASNVVRLLDLGEVGPGELGTSGNQDRSQLSGERELYVSFAEIYGGTLLQILDDLGVDRLYLCIDEWSTLDPTANTVIQPEFADLIKIAFKGNGRISVKIATNKFQTMMNNQSPSRAFRGLELGADIAEAINLDHLTLDHEELWSFYVRLIFKRLEAVEPQLEVFRTPPNEISPEFIKSLFHDERAFDELVVGADAVPRNFLRIISKLYGDRGYDPRDRWRGELVNEEIRVRGATGHREIGYKTQAHQMMATAIRPVVVASARREFLARTVDEQRLKRGFDELFEKRLIHEVPTDQLPVEAREEYRGFRLDYGVLLDWLALPFDESEPVKGRRAPIASLGSGWHDLVIDTSKVEAEVLECPTCQTEFSPEEASFRARGLCPHCFEETGLDWQGVANQAGDVGDSPL